MHFQFEVAPPQSPSAPESFATAQLGEATALLRQLVELQREQLQLQRHQLAMQDSVARWRVFWQRWQKEFPQLPTACKQILPKLEQSYLHMIENLTELVETHEQDGLDNEFVLGEFLDRYGMRLGQLGTLIGLLGPLAEAAPKPEE